MYYTSVRPCLELCRSFRLVIWMVLMIAGVNGATFAATRVAINIDEPYEQRKVSWPITTGIPFPRGELKQADNCRLVDDTGKERPLQSRVAATWDVARTSIRWLTIDFIAEPGRLYWLEFGPEITRVQPNSPIQIEKGEPLKVSTGVLNVKFSKKAAAALGSITVDLDGNGVIEPNEIVAAGSPNGEHYYLDQQGRRFSNAADGNERQVVVEATGPVRCCIRVDGFYTGPKGERIVRYRTRYHLFAGLGLIKLVDEFRIVGSTRETQFADIGFALKIPPASQTRKVTADVSGEPGNQTATVNWRSETESVSSYQSTYRHYGNQEYEAAFVEVSPTGSRRLAQPDRMGEWMQVADDNGSITGSLRWFWQQFPKEWECQPDEMILHLWSPQGGQLDFGPKGMRDFFGEQGRKYILEWEGTEPPKGTLQRYKVYGAGDAIQKRETDGQGINKHHEIYLHFAAPGSAKTGQEYGKLAAKQPIALASGEWNCSTDVFGPLMPRPSGAGSSQLNRLTNPSTKTRAKHAHLKMGDSKNSKYEAIVDKLFDLGRYVQDAFGDYGWWVFGSGPHYSYRWDPIAKRHHADPMRFDFHTYQKETQLWWNYLRSGERKFYDWAIPSENHWADIAVAHVPMKYECDWIGGDAAGKTRTLHWQPGDWNVDSPIHFHRNHNNAEAWLRSGAQFWASYHRTLETTTLAYYLTGDERFNDVIEYWRDYWGDLAGMTTTSTEMKPWHREQPWFQVAKKIKNQKTWAEMIRDYAPFSSGMRHEMTLFFSLATLYEHTWDPRLKQVLDEYADAFLDPAGPIGVWMSQDNSGPAKADAPWMSHYWLPALWKYGRATGDSRMKDIFSKYFNAVYAADPFRGHVGVYSNVHLGYAYYFTRDPRFLTLAKLELDELMQFAQPIKTQAEVGQRLYNPYAPIRCFTGVPRLEWAIHEAEKNKVAVPASYLTKPQRTAIALFKHANKPLKATLWGYDREFKLIGPDGKPFRQAAIKTNKHSSKIQPFDRTMPGFAVYLHELTIPANAPAGFYVLSPRLEMAVLALQGSELVLLNASQPISIEKSTPVFFRLPANSETLSINSPQASSLRLLDAQGNELPKKLKKYVARFEIASELQGQWCKIETGYRLAHWFRIVDLPTEQCWVATANVELQQFPSRTQTVAAVKPSIPVDREKVFIQGKFGKAIQIVRGRELRIPDYVELNGKTVRLFDLKQGTIEFWVKMLTDRRISPYRSPPLLTNGYLNVPAPLNLPYNEWAHIAISWRRTNRDPNVSVIHVYVNGLDTQYYRSLWWVGYGSKAGRISETAKWLKEFLLQPSPDAVFAVDELRVSTIARYADADVEFGPQQTFNPYVFKPIEQPFTADDHTTLLFHFDGDLKDAAENSRQSISGKLPEKSR